MTLFSKYFAALEQRYSVEGYVSHLELFGHTQDFLDRHWITPLGFLSTLMVPVLETEEEVEIKVNEKTGTYNYASPQFRQRQITRPLSEIAIYAFNPDVWLDDLAILFDIEPARRSRRRTVIDGHLWHLGDLRVSQTHTFAPLYVASLLQQCSDDWRNALCDQLRPSQGIVLTHSNIQEEAPNNHQFRDLDLLIAESPHGPVCDRELLKRLLSGKPTESGSGHEHFDARSGALILPHMQEPKFFKGKQKDVITLFWKERHLPYLKWSDIKARTNCAKDPDSVFGKKVWREWLEHFGQGGLYRLKTRRAGN